MKTKITRHNWLKRDGHRLGASYYCNEGLVALQILEQDHILSEDLQDLCEVIYIPPRFKRPYVDDPKFGYRYITGSSMILADPSLVDTYLSKTLTPNIDRLMLTEGMILTTCSGTIGRSVIVNSDLQGCIGSPDLLRIVPNPDKIELGYLYSVLSSNLGRSLIEMQIYGSVVDHIEAHHVYKLPIPILENELRQQINVSTLKAWSNRSEANRLLHEASELFYSSLNLPKLSSSDYGTSSGQKQQQILTIGSQDLDLRLDASHYSNEGRKATLTIEHRDDCRLIGDPMVTRRVFHPFRMNMVIVDEGYGVPFLGGGDIVDNRYYGEKHISEVTDNYEDFILRRNWTLMTIGGTIGRTTFVSDYIDGWAASQHVTRFVPNEENVLPGYLYAFINSDYAQYQVQNIVYGSVIDTVRESQLANLRIPVPSKEVQQPIHDAVEEAYRLRFEAIKLEDEAQDLLVKEIGLHNFS